MNAPTGTQVAIVGGGPAGLLLVPPAARRRGVDRWCWSPARVSASRPASAPASSSTARSTRCARSGRTRGWTREGLPHDGFELRFEGRSVRVDMQEPHRRARDDLGADRGDARPHRAAPGAGRAAAVRRRGALGSRTSRPTVRPSGTATTAPSTCCTRTSSSAPTASTGWRAARSREHRAALRARLPVLVAGDPRRRRPRPDELIYARGRTGFALPRCARRRSPAPTSRCPTAPTPPTGPTTRSGTSSTARFALDDAVVHPGPRADHRQVGDADAQHGHRADAPRAAVPRRRRRAHRPAHRGEGAQPRGRRRAGARPRRSPSGSPPRTRR